jgi:hypothetical protein
VFSLLPLFMLATRNGTADPAPELSQAGSLALGMLVALLLVGMAHTTHVLVSRR